MKGFAGRARLTGKGSASGFTFIELLVVTAILLVLASAVMPLARVSVQRQKEMELRRYLREMRLAVAAGAQEPQCMFNT